MVKRDEITITKVIIHYQTPINFWARKLGYIAHDLKVPCNYCKCLNYHEWVPAKRVLQELDETLWKKRRYM